MIQKQKTERVCDLTAAEAHICEVIGSQQPNTSGTMHINEARGHVVWNGGALDEEQFTEAMQSLREKEYLLESEGEDGEKRVRVVDQRGSSAPDHSTELSKLKSRVKSLENRLEHHLGSKADAGSVTKLESRIESLDTKLENRTRGGSQSDTEEQEVTVGDWRDRQVLNRIDEGSVVNAAVLAKVYRQYVGMTNEERIANRVDRLLDTILFELPERDVDGYIYVGDD